MGGGGGRWKGRQTSEMEGGDVFDGGLGDFYQGWRRCRGGREEWIRGLGQDHFRLPFSPSLSFELDG